MRAVDKRKRQWWHFRTETLERAAHVVTIVGFPLILFSTLVVVYQVVDVRRIAQSQNNIALNAHFFNDTNSGIFGAIESGEPILKPKGKYNSVQLDNYLGDFETINQAYQDKLLSEAQMCTSFSEYIIETTKNAEVRKYLDDNPDYFSGLLSLKAAVDSSKNDDCKSD